MVANNADNNIPSGNDFFRTFLVHIVVYSKHDHFEICTLILFTENALNDKKRKERDDDDSTKKSKVLFLYFYHLLHIKIINDKKKL